MKKLLVSVLLVLLVTTGCVRRTLEPAGITAACDKFRAMQIEEAEAVDAGVHNKYSVEQMMGAQDNCDESKAK